MDELVFSCITCNKQIQEGIWNSTFYPNLITVLSAFIVLAVIVAALSAVSAKRFRTNTPSSTGIYRLTPVPLTTASIILGIGLGGFIDGIVLHQTFQWHEMLSNKVPATEYVGKSINMFWDGIFHLFCLMVVLVGVIMMWRLLRRANIDKSGNLLGGGLLLGWGIFNIVEGIIDHHLLKLHNVMEQSSNHDVGNYSFLGISVVMIILGYIIANRRRKSDITPAPQVNVT